MRDPGLPPEPEELLRHGSFLRAVVRALLRDEHEVDDVVQDTYVAALGGRHSPGWLTTVARNFARTVRRSERRRRKRERVAARLESVPSAAAMAQRLELQERLVAAVRTLESPYREVVVLRFYEGLPPREIARALGVPVETVRTRLQRALGLLRGRLDRLSEGGRRAWQLVLAPLALKAKPAAAAPLLVGGAVVKTKVTFVVLLLSALFTAIFLANAERPEQAPQREEARKTPAVLDDAEAGEEEEAATVRPQISAVRATDSREPKPETVTPRLKRIVGKPKEQEPPPVGSAAVTGRFRLKGDLPPESVKVLLSGTYKDSEGKWQTFKLERVTNATGEFSFEDLPSAVFTFEATREGFAPHEFRFSLADGATKGPLDILLTHGGDLRVLVTDSHGRPREGMQITVSRSLESGYQKQVARGRTDAEGCFLAEHLVPGSHWIERHSGSWNSGTRTATVVPDQVTEVTFKLDSGLTGSILGPDGQPLAKALVRLTPVDFGDEGYRSYSAQADEKGAYSVEGVPTGEYAVGIQVFGPNGYSTRVGTVTIPVGAMLDHPVRVPSTRIAGRITRADTGKPMSNQSVQITADRVRILEDGSKDWRHESMGMAFADKDGRYAFVGLPPGHYKIWIAPFRASLRQIEHFLDLGAGQRIEDLDFAVETKRMGSLRVTVLEPDETPAKGLAFTLVKYGEAKGDLAVAYSTTLFAREVGDGVYYLSLERGERIVGVHREGFVPEELKVTIGDKVVKRTVKLRAKP